MAESVEDLHDISAVADAHQRIAHVFMSTIKKTT
jgi:hypothetical protein